CRHMFGYRPRSQHLCLFRLRKETGQFVDHAPLHLFVSQATKLPGSAHDHLQVMFAWLNLAAVEHPLADTVYQYDVWQLHYGPVVPDVYAGDRRRFHLPEIAKVRMGRHNFRGQQIEQPIKRHRRNVPVRVQALTAAQLDAFDALAHDPERPCSAVKSQLDAVAFQPTLQLFSIKSAEWYLRDLKLEAAPVPQKPVPEYLPGVAEADPVRRLVQIAGQH